MSNDRKQLIRLAASLPKGDEKRKVLLAELQKTSARGSLDDLMTDWFEDLSRKMFDIHGRRGSKMKVRHLGPNGFYFTLGLWMDSARNYWENVEGELLLVKGWLKLEFGNEAWSWRLTASPSDILAKWRELNSYDFDRRMAASNKEARGWPFKRSQVQYNEAAKQIVRSLRSLPEFRKVNLGRDQGPTRGRTIFAIQHPDWAEPTQIKDALKRLGYKSFYDGRVFGKKDEALWVDLEDFMRGDEEIVVSAWPGLGSSYLSEKSAFNKEARFPKGLVQSIVSLAEANDWKMPSQWEKKFLSKGDPYVCAVCGSEDLEIDMLRDEKWGVDCENCGSGYYLHGEYDVRMGDGDLEDLGSISWNEGFGNFRQDPARDSWLYSLAKDYEKDWNPRTAKIQKRARGWDGKLEGPKARAKWVRRGQWPYMEIEELPGKPFKRKLRKAEFRWSNHGQQWPLLMENVLEDARLSRSMDYDKMVRAMKNALKKIPGKYDEKTVARFGPMPEYVQKELDRQPYEETVFYLNVEPANYDPISFQGKDFGGTSEWTEFTFYSDSDEYDHQEGQRAFHKSTSAGGARKLFKMLKANPDLVRNMKERDFEDLLNKNKIGFRYVPTVWR